MVPLDEELREMADELVFITISISPTNKQFWMVVASKAHPTIPPQLVAKLPLMVPEYTQFATTVAVLLKARIPPHVASPLTLVVMFTSEEQLYTIPPIEVPTTPPTCWKSVLMLPDTCRLRTVPDR